MRWTTVLTNAPLPAGTPMAQRCGDCRACIDICPQKALTGKSFIETEPREERYDARACERYFKEMESEGKVPVCGLCLFVCPHGRRASRN